MIDERELKFVIPSEGRLYEGSRALLKEAGIEWQGEGEAFEVMLPEGKLILGFRKSKDVVKEVASGRFDMGIAPWEIARKSDANKVGFFVKELGFERTSLIYNRLAFSQGRPGGEFNLFIRRSIEAIPSEGDYTNNMIGIVRSRLDEALLRRGNGEVYFQRNWQRIKYEW